ncbi:MAG: hypothetical protein OEO77_08875 [Acidimicrobiia bacterium]|nr:hypothetical protein [Acidimicrobiia bacterium]
MQVIHLDVYGRFDLMIERRTDQVSIFRSLSDGKHLPVSDLHIPTDADVDEIIDLVDIAFHQFAGPGDAVRVR